MLRLSYKPSARLVLLLLAAVTGAVAWGLLYQGHPDLGAGAATPQEALARLLRQQHNLVLTDVGFLDDPQSATWREARGWWPVFATATEASDDTETPEDLYYFEVRTNAAGKPLQARFISNLTRTPYAREHLIERRADHALFGVEVFGQQQALLMVDFSRDERDLSAITKPLDKARMQISNLQKTGRPEGIGMRLYNLQPPPRRITAKPLPDSFALSLFDANGKAHQATLSTTTGDSSVSAEGPQLQYQPRFFALKGATPWLVDTIRDLSWVGPRKIALLERFVFRWADTMRQTAFNLGLMDAGDNLAAELGQAEDAQGLEVTLGQGAFASKDWPPPPVPSAMPKPEKGEGQWTPVRLDWMRALPGAPPAFYKTAIRMDPKRPYDNIVLIAMDMRQLDLGLVAGTITPESSFGNRGTGLLPRDPKVVNRLVAAFNGGFKTAHGAYGMMVERTTILPPIPFAATLAVADDGKVAMGSWYNSMKPPEDLHSFRQNLPPLMADGRVNPTGKRKWGGTASDLDDIHTTRSGVGVRPENTLIYAWCRSCSADALAEAMMGAGCQYGMHLDMNPTHTGWSYYRTDTKDLSAKNTFMDHKVQKGSPRMDFKESRYIERDVKDFFYLTLREDMRATLPTPPEGFAPWTTDKAPTGTEGFLPIAAVSTGPTPGDVLVALEAPQLTAQARRGDKEPDPTAGLAGAAATPTSQELALKTPVALLDLGLASPQGPGALYAGGRIIAPPIPGQPALVIGKDNSVKLLPAQALASLTPHQVALLRGGPSLVHQGKPAATLPTLQGKRQHALGLTDTGKMMLLSQAKTTAQALAREMIALGVTEAMLLPPGQAPRLSFLQVRDGKPWELTPTGTQAQPLQDTRQRTTHAFLEVVPAGPRAVRLKLEDVKLDPAEAKRQRRLQSQIQALRQELRAVENAKYKAFLEKKKGN